MRGDSGGEDSVFQSQAPWCWEETRRLGGGVEGALLGGGLVVGEQRRKKEGGGGEHWDGVRVDCCS